DGSTELYNQLRDRIAAALEATLPSGVRVSSDDIEYLRYLEKAARQDWREPGPAHLRAEHRKRADTFKRILAAVEPAPAPQNAHHDDLAVDRFAAAMKDKLAKKRAEGRGGWDRKDECSGAFLSQLLVEHVE